MTISVKCSSCGEVYTVRDELARKQANCKCGRPIVIPQPDSIQSLLDEALPLADDVGNHATSALVGSPPDGLPEGAELPASVPRSLGKPPAKKGGFNPVLTLGVVGVILIGLLVFVPNWGGGDDSESEVTQAGETGAAVARRGAAEDATAQSGAATPEEAFENFKRLTIAKDYRAMLNAMTPKSREFSFSMAATIAMKFAETDTQMADLLDRHGISETMREDSADAMSKELAAAPQDRAQAIIGGTRQRQRTLLDALKDKQTFYIAVMERAGQVSEERLATSGQSDLLANAEKAQAEALLVDVRISGDTAEGKQTVNLGDSVLEVPASFQRIDGRWYVHLPAVAGKP